MAKKKVTEISENQFKVKFYKDLAKELNFINGVKFHKLYEKECTKAWNTYRKS